MNKSTLLTFMLIVTLIPGMILSMPGISVSSSHVISNNNNNKIMQEAFAQFNEYRYNDYAKPYDKKKNFAQIERFDDKLFVCDNGIVVDDRTQCPLKCPFGTTLDGAYVMDLEICDIEPGIATKKCSEGTDLEGVLVMNKNQCDLFAECDADSPLGLSLGGLEPIKVADVQLCQLSAPDIQICDSGFFEGFAVDNQQTCNTPFDSVNVCGPTSDLAGMLTTDIQSCNIFETCLANSPLGMALGGTEVDVADAELCNLEIPEQTELVVCDLDTPMGGAVVTDPLLCQAPNDNNKCPADTDLEGVYVMDTASDCNIFATCDAGTALGKALGMQNEFKVADEVLCDLEIPPEVELFQCIGGPMEGAIVTDELLCEAPNSGNKCPPGSDLEGAYVMDPLTQCNLDIPEPIECPESGFLVTDEANCPIKCPDGKYIMQGMECPSVTTQLTVFKDFIGCVDDTNGTIQCPDDVPSQPSDFDIDVTGNNPNPSMFEGNDLGTVVSIEPGLFDVTEQQVSSPAPDECASVIGAPFDAGASLGDGQFICTNFVGDCSGNISEGEDLTCTIENTIFIDEPGLTVFKNFNGCVDENNAIVNCPDDVPSQPSDFDIDVTGNNPNPSMFLGDNAGTMVDIEPGLFDVTEQQVSSPAPDECASVIGAPFDAGASLGDGQFICTNFVGDCDDNIMGGEDLTCTIENVVFIDLGQLTVFKDFIECVNNENTTIACPSQDLDGAEDFTMGVTGTNVNPFSMFPGSEAGTVLTMEPGVFDVTEDLTNPQTDITSPAPDGCDNVVGGPFDAGADLGNNQFICTNFIGDCTGNIIATDDLTCTVENTVLVNPGQLTVFKNFNGCVDNTNSTTDCPEGVPIQPSDFNIDITGNNATPDSFVGDNSGTIVTIDPGAFDVTEQEATSPPPVECASVIGAPFDAGADLSDIEDGTFLCTSFTGDCSGNINSNDDLSCTINNIIVVGPEEPEIGQLTVFKDFIDCFDNENNTTTCPSQDLDDAEDFTMEVLGTNVNPFSMFPGSEVGTVLTIEPGVFDVTEDLTNPQTDITSPAPDGCDNVVGGPFDAGADLGNNQFICTNFVGDCTGNIMAADNLICTVENTVVVPVSTAGEKVCVTWDENDTGQGGTGNDEIYVACSADGGMSFDPPVRISNSTNPGSGDSRHPDIAVDGNNVYVTWQDGSPSNDDIFFSKSTDMGATFSDSENISDNSGSTSLEPEIVVAENGNIIIVWQEDTSEQDILAVLSDDEGETFSTPLNLSDNDAESINPVIEVSGNTIVIAWEDKTSGNFDIFTLASTNGGVSFSAPTGGENISDDSNAEDLHPEIAISGTNIVIVWDKDGDNIFAAISNDSGANYGSPINVSTTNAESKNGNVVISGTNIIIVYEDKNGNNDEFDVFVWVRDVSGGTPAVTNLSNNASLSDQAEIVVLGDNVVVVWQDAGNGGTDLFKRTSTDNGDNFGAVENISNTGGVQSFDDGATENAQAMVAVGNNVFITWEDSEAPGNEGNDETLFNKSIDGGLSFFFDPPVNLSSVLGTGNSQHQSIGAQ